MLSPRFDLVAHNQATEIILGDLTTQPQYRRNLLLWIFDGDAGWSATGSNWQRTARANLLDFRTEYARHPGDPAYVSLVDELT